MFRVYLLLDIMNPLKPEPSQINKNPTRYIPSHNIILINCHVPIFILYTAVAQRSMIVCFQV